MLCPMQRPSVKRHLPVAKSADSEGNTPQSPWVCVFLGGMISVSLWVPLAMLSLAAGNWLGRWGSTTDSATVWPRTVAVPTAGLVLISFALACAVGGALLRRLSVRARSWDTALCGAYTALVVLSFAALGHALQPSSVGASIAASLLVIGPITSSLGGRLARPRPRNNR